MDEMKSIRCDPSARSRRLRFLARVRACDDHSTNPRPRSDTSPASPGASPAVGYARLLLRRSISAVTAKQRVVTACQTRQWRCMGETQIRFVRSSLGIGRVLGGCSDQGHPFCCSPTVDPPQDVLQVPRLSLATGSVLLRRRHCVGN